MVFQANPFREQVVRRLCKCFIPVVFNRGSTEPKSSVSTSQGFRGCAGGQYNVKKRLTNTKY